MIWITGKIRLITVLLLTGIAMFSSSAFSQQQEVRLFGHAPEYSNYAIVFEHYNNFLNYEQEELFTIELGDNGEFDFTYQLDNITFAFVDLGKFRGFIYLQPGKEYELKLPPLEELSQSQKLNPFFEPEHILLGIANEKPTGLNPMIRDFDDAFYFRLNNNAQKLITSRNKQLLNELIDTLETRFPDKHEYFSSHKHFRYARLEMLATRNKEKDVIEKYYSNTPVHFEMPAYWESFKDIFRGFGRKLFDNDELIKRDVDFQYIREKIKKDTLYQRTDLAETMLLWALYESYHEKIIPRKKTLNLLQEVATKASYPEIRQTASTIYERINALREDTEAPDFKLSSFSGKTRSLEDYQGSFVYLNFIHTNNHSCRRDLKLLPKLKEKFGRDLKIVTIIINDDYEEARQFIDRNKDMSWDFLFFGLRANILKDYNVQAVPLYYLINPDGKLVLSPAPTPNENFDDYFVDQYRKYQREQQRKHPQERKSIFDK